MNILKKIKQEFLEGLKLIEEYEKTFEVWRTITDIPTYSASSFGRIRNDRSGLILKPYLNTTKYFMVNLYHNRNIKKVLVSRIVGQAFVRNPLKKDCIDHIDGNPHNNHFHNLRWVTRQENAFNKKLRKGNSSGFNGVNLNQKTNKWSAVINVNGRRYQLGTYKNKKDAIEARQEAEKKYFGKFRRQ
jgi:hypothetical protein